MTLMRAAVAALFLLVLAPLVNMVLSVTPAALGAALASPATVGALRTSLVASLGSIAVATVLGVPAGYALARGRAVLRGVALLVLAIPLALPPVASGIALLGLLGTRRGVGGFLEAHGVHVVDSLAGVGIAEFFVSGSVVAIAATAAFADVDRTLEDAARTLGANTIRVLFTVALPLAAPSIGAGVVLAWLRAVGEYGATSIVAYHPTSLPIELVDALSADGVSRALALAEAFVVMTVAVAAVAALVRRRLA